MPSSPSPSREVLLELYRSRSAGSCAFVAISSILMLVVVGVCFYYVWHSYKHLNQKTPKEQSKPQGDTSTQAVTVFNEQDSAVTALLSHMPEKQVSVVMVYHPGCGYCKNMKEDFEKFAQGVAQLPTKPNVLKIWPGNFQAVTKMFPSIDESAFQGVPFIFAVRGDRSDVYEFDKPYSKTLRYRSSDSLTEWFSGIDWGDKPVPDPELAELTESESESEPEPEVEPQPEPEPQPKPSSKKPKKVAFADDGKADEPVKKTKGKRFLPSENWDGEKAGYEFKMGKKGLGYYRKK